MSRATNELGQSFVLQKQSMMAAVIQTSIRIGATPEKVWNILTDFGEMPNWNPFVQAIEGQAEVGRKIKVKLPGMTFKPVVKAFDKNRRFRWLGHFLVPGIFDGEHYFELEDNGDGTTTFHHGEQFKGWLVPVFKGNMLEKTRQGFEAMNRALKEKAEL